MTPETGWRKQLYVIIFESDTRLGKIFDILILWAILLSVLSIMLESDVTIKQQYSQPLRYAEWFFTALFTLEYVLRVVCVQKPSKYIFSFFGVVDFISIAPTYVGMFFGGTHFLMVIRAVRLLRVFRILKLVRYLQESQVLLQALKASRIKITVFLGAVLTINLIVGTILHLVESDNPGFSNIFKGMYWAVVTMTTVGYGDAVPTTALGKFISSLVMLMGYGVLAVPTGIVSAELANLSKPGINVCPYCDAGLLTPEARYCHECGKEQNQN